MKIAWLLHLHQPSTQDPAVVRDISNSCYRPLLAILDRHSGFRMTLDISGSLLNWWSAPASLQRDKSDQDYSDILDTLRKLIQRGQIEVTGTGCYHPVLTLLPESEVRRQIGLQEECLETKGLCHVKSWRDNPSSGVMNLAGLNSNAARKTLDSGEPGSPSPRFLRGFFPPELAVNDALIKTLSSLNYDYVIADEVASLGHSHFLQVGNNKTKVVIRDRGASLAVAFGYAHTKNNFVNIVHSYSRFSESLVLVMDGETFGHHWPGSTKLLEDICDIPEFDYLTVSELAVLQTFEVVPGIRECSWGASDSDLVSGNVYPFWRGINNPIHNLQWELTNLAINVVGAIHESPSTQSRELLDQALQSDQFWWASGSSVDRLHWEPSMVKKGADLLLKAITCSDCSESDKNKAKELYNKIEILINPK